MKAKLGSLKRAVKGVLDDARQGYVPVPSGAAKLKVADSIESRSIYAYKIGDGPVKVMLTGGIHGNEVGSVKLAHSILTYIAEICSLTDEIPGRITFIVIPCLNVDGFQKALKKRDYLGGGRIGRFNARDVDLNRNFPAESFTPKALWSFGKNYGRTKEVFAGEMGASEPEVKGIIDFIKKNNINIWFSFHNAGNDVLPSSDDLAKRLAREFSKESGFVLLKEKEWRDLKQTGTPKEWCEENKVSYIEVEGTSRWASDWPALRPAIEHTLEAVVQVNK